MPYPALETPGYFRMSLRAMLLDLYIDESVLREIFAL
jgi:hypothetical protein